MGVGRAGLERGRNEFWVGRIGVEAEVSMLGRKPCILDGDG